MVRHRNTPQRTAIQMAFKQGKRPLSVDEILASARRQVASLDQATVYRNLKRLVEEGWLVRVALPSNGVFYEMADERHHHHFHCRRCERTYDLPGCGLDPEKQAPAEFRVEGHDVFLYGLCPGCAGVA